MTNIFDPLSKKDNHRLLASHTQQGKAWENAFNISDDFGKLFYGLAIEFYRFQVLEQKLFKEMDIAQTDELLTDWERSVSIPDRCFGIDFESDSQRKQQVEQKFANFGGVQLTVDFIRVAAAFDFTIEQITGAEAGITFATRKEEVHTLIFVITSDLSSDSVFPIPFPLSFSQGGTDFLQCLFEQLAPANVDVIIISEGDLP